MERRMSSGPQGEASQERELAALRAGDEEAYLRLVRRHHPAMIRVASLHVHSAAAAEEVAQEAWLGVLRGLHQFEGRSSLRAWIFGILLNCARARAIREGRTVPFSALEAERGEDAPSVPPDRFLGAGDEWAGHWAAPPSPWPEAWVASRELMALVQAALARLPEGQRAVMSLRDVEGWGAEEVCELLGISEGNQRVLLHRARSKVRGDVERQLGREEHA